MQVGCEGSRHLYSVWEVRLAWVRLAFALSVVLLSVAGLFTMEDRKVYVVESLAFRNQLSLLGSP